MSEARDKVTAALVALLVQIILIVSGVCFYEDTAGGLEVAVAGSAQGVREPH